MDYFAGWVFIIQKKTIYAAINIFQVLSKKKKEAKIARF